MTAVIGALAPIFGLIVLGYAMRQGRFVPLEFWPAAEKVTYYVFFPALLVHSLGTAALDLEALLPMVGALAGGVLATGAIVLALRRAWGADGPAFTSIFQGAIRPNTYVGLAAAAGLYGEAGLTLAAIGIAVVVPLVNLMVVPVLARHGAGADPRLRAVALGIVTNPIIIAVALGLALQLLGLRLPPLLGPMVEILGRAALPVGLLAVGAGLDLKAARSAGRHVGLGTAAKLVAAPGLTALGCWLLGVDGLQLAIAVLYNALPTSASSYVLARQMGGDATLMAGIITVTTIAAALTLPLVVLLAG
jgi:predicted permease